MTRFSSISCCTSRLATSTHHRSHVPRTGATRSQRTRRSELAMDALAEITLEEHEVSCRGGEITPATHFPAQTSCRILVRTRAFVTSHLDPNFVSSTQPRKPKRSVVFCHGCSSTTDVEHRLACHPFVRWWIHNRATNNASARCASVSSCLFGRERERDW